MSLQNRLLLSRRVQLADQFRNVPVHHYVVNLADLNCPGGEARNRDPGPEGLFAGWTEDTRWLDTPELLFVCATCHPGHLEALVFRMKLIDLDSEPWKAVVPRSRETYRYGTRTRSDAAILYPMTSVATRASTRLSSLVE